VLSKEQKYLLDAVRAFRAGQDPPHLVRDVAHNRFPHMDTIAEIVEGDWREQLSHLARATV
jgi:hypothetical protein